MAGRIDKDELQLGIMHGLEYAWVKKQYPEVKPLVLAINQTTNLKAYLVVRNDSTAKSVADLKGKTLSFPKRAMNHSYLYLHKSIIDAGHNPTGFFTTAPLPAQ